MLATLIPLFDENMSVSAYSLFSQRENYLTDPRFFVTAQLDGAGNINGLEIVNTTGLETLTSGTEVFVPINNVSIFADITSQCEAPHDEIVFLIDNTITPEDMYVKRINELKHEGFKFAIRKIAVSDYEAYHPILSNVDYVFLNYQKIDIEKAKIFFSKRYPSMKLIAGNIPSQEEFDRLTATGGYDLFEGPFYRVPITKGVTEVSPLKINYIELLNTVNENNFELTEAADIIGRDTALVISLLKMVNRFTVNSEITTIRHAAAMLGQKELKKWITTAVAQQMCFDKPNEIMRLSLIRAKFAENLAPIFGNAVLAQELFLTGLFSVIDLILGKPMNEALEMLNVSANINKALISREGPLAETFDFLLHYEVADWQEVSRVMVVNNLSMDDVYNAYVNSVQWYTKLVSK